MRLRMLQQPQVFKQAKPFPLIHRAGSIPCTVYEWHTRWREKEVIRTDTIQVETTRSETVQVRYVPSFYKYCTAFALCVPCPLAPFCMVALSTLPLVAWTAFCWIDFSLSPIRCAQAHGVL